MPDQVDDTLAMILVSNVLILEKLLRAEQRDKGVHRIGDYLDDAVALLRNERLKVFKALQRRQ
jgi:hypothetical protein